MHELNWFESRKHVLQQVQKAKQFVSEREQNNEPNKNVQELKRLHALENELQWFTREY
ncbi:hypothetical protein HXA34_20055 [Salipaludibacillus agaradhaerens]|jgi:hypothetical protein|uniref:hypothetical protein n=1 Tax=Salipaludibacillus agaradhaerens TaxID=76935 RepID=UPI0021511019|nr:hypothetical protein [Salipaludibacillus agaradhaerens]MCR6108585.1 hypothetical protein [Salipaludibacillus agaradhaerens]MCR6120614.1 hypothetical protein [Salipaludibacillus agaradhaerens]